jgi:hypothetical protein
MDNQTQLPAAVSADNVKAVAAMAPVALEENRSSHSKCIAFGQKLLEEAQLGMTDDLDQRIAAYMEKARKTVKKMNEKRSPVTKLFDMLRANYTQLENEVDPSKAGTIPYRLQQARNSYAAKKREEAERERQRKEMLVKVEQAKERYVADIVSDMQQGVSYELNNNLDMMDKIFRGVTLDTYAEAQKKISEYPCALHSITVRAVPSPLLDKDVAEAIKQDTYNRHAPELVANYEQEMKLSRQRYVDMLPSKKAELEKAAQASAEEAARIRAEIERREEEERQRKQAELAKQEEERRKQAEMAAKNAEMGSLFASAQVAAPVYQPKASVKKKLFPMNAEAFVEIFKFWWLKEGCTLSVEELSKVLKKQLSFCEKSANDKTSPEFINSEHLYYEDEVKAK